MMVLGVLGLGGLVRKYTIKVAIVSCPKLQPYMPCNYNLVSVGLLNETTENLPVGSDSTIFDVDFPFTFLDFDQKSAVASLGLAIR